MVALAQSPPGGSSARSLQKKTTVMLGSARRANQRSGCQAIIRKYSSFSPPQITLHLAPSRPGRGALAIVTNVGAGCGGRGSVGRVVVFAGRALLRERTQRADDRRQCPAKPKCNDGWLRTAKPCGPGTRCWCQADGGASTQPGSDNPSIRQRR